MVNKKKILPVINGINHNKKKLTPLLAKGRTQLKKQKKKVNERITHVSHSIR